MFPYVWPEGVLTPKDFSLLELQFSKTILYFLPCDALFFITAEQYPGTSSDKAPGEDMFETWKAGVSLARKERQPVVNAGGSLLFLPIWQDNDIIAVAVVDGGSSAKYGDYSAEWLQERSRLVSREFRKTKERAYDSESGLLAGWHLREGLEALLHIMAVPDKQLKRGEVNKAIGDQLGQDLFSWTLFLIEIYPRAKNSGQASIDISGAAAALSSLLGERVPISHLGSGLFGMLWNAEEEESQNLAYALIRKLKRQNFAKVHIGIAPLAFSDGEKAAKGLNGHADFVFNQAWQYLQSARGRGPFAVCSAVGQTAANIFSRPPQAIMSALQNSWRAAKIFSLAVLQDDSAKNIDQPFSKRIISLAGEEAAILPVNASEAYIYLPGKDEAQALNWLEKLQGKIAKINQGAFSIGVASFPYHNFKKTDVPVNARKALVHTGFFGPGSVTAFSGVSLNISGDVYYNEGDLAGAVKEYKLGLKIDPQNINLMNSLAVIYAQVNRYRQAIPLFEKVVSLDSADFMALFNLGFAHLTRKNTAKAVEYFEEAYKIDDGYFDLLLQLGQLYCEMGNYRRALKFLHEAEKSVSAGSSAYDGSQWQKTDDVGTVKNIGHGQVFKYLGKAYVGAGDNKAAMVYFQRAIGYNARDPESLSQLGSLYLAGKEGVEVALSLCRQAVKQDDLKSAYWFHLAQAQLAAKDFDGVVMSLSECLRLDRKNIEAMLMLARAYTKLGRRQQASLIYRKVLRIDKNNKKAKLALKA